MTVPESNSCKILKINSKIFHQSFRELNETSSCDDACCCLNAFFKACVNIGSCFINILLVNLHIHSLLLFQAT